MTTVPALLTLLRERSWMMPAWLDRALPNLTIEPPTDEPEPLAGPTVPPLPGPVATRPRR
jgi:RND superfamily putative drug exporter